MPVEVCYVRGSGKGLADSLMRLPQGGGNGFEGATPENPEGESGPRA
jgi:hypothetical protein